MVTCTAAEYFTIHSNRELLVSRLPSPVSRLASPVSRLPSPVSRPNWHLHHRSCIRKELERIQLEAAEKLEATLEAEQAKIRARRKLQRDMYKVRCASFALRLYVEWRHVQAC